MRVAGIVLAAGSGTRFGEPKAPVVIDGERLVDHAVRVLRDAGCEPVVVVLGAWIGDVPNAIIAENADWAEGMGSSLRVGLKAVAPLDVDAAVITLVDLPGLTSEAVARVAGADAELVAATYDGERGHPVKFGRGHWEAVSSVAVGDAGARTYLSGRGDLMLVEVGDVASGVDLDERD